MSEQTLWIILYDGECQLCIQMAEAVKRWDREGQFATRTYQFHFAMDSSIPLEELQEEVHMLGPHGEIKKGPEALQFIMQHIPQVKPFSWIFEGETGKKASRFGMGILGAFRNRFKKSCKNCTKCGRRTRPRRL